MPINQAYINAKLSHIHVLVQAQNVHNSWNSHKCSNNKIYSTHSIYGQLKRKKIFKQNLDKPLKIFHIRKTDFKTILNTVIQKGIIFEDLQHDSFTKI